MNLHEVITVHICHNNKSIGFFNGSAHEVWRLASLECRQRASRDKSSTPTQWKRDCNNAKVEFTCGNYSARKIVK